MARGNHRLALRGVLLGCADGSATRPRRKTALRLGAEAMHRGKPEEAEKFFREVRQLAPQLADGDLDMGFAQLKQGNRPRRCDYAGIVVFRRYGRPGDGRSAGIGDRSRENAAHRLRRKNSWQTQNYA